MLFLESSGQLCFVKPANYDAQKTKKFRVQIRRIENTRYIRRKIFFVRRTASFYAGKNRPSLYRVSR